MIEFECRHCLEVIRLSDEKAGSSGKCPHCRELVTVPAVGDLALHDYLFDKPDTQPDTLIPVANSQNVHLSSQATTITGNIAAWVFGLLFVYFFLNSVLRFPLASIPALIGAALLLPPSYQRANRLFKARLGAEWRVMGSVVLLFVYLMMYTSAMFDESRQRTQESAALAQKAREDEKAVAAQAFKEKKVVVVAEANELIGQGKVTEALNHVRSYRGLQDGEIEAVVEKAELKSKAMANEAKKASLLQTLSTLDTDKLHERAKIYDQLMAIAPEDEEFKKKYTETRDAMAKEAVDDWTRQQAANARALKQSLGLEWSYVDTQDEMTQKPIRKALVISTNTLSFGFPYDGAQHATLQLRKHPRWGSDVILEINRGQFLCSSYDGCSVTVRFGKGKPQRFSATEPDDNDTTLLFIRNYKGFVSQMRKVDQVVIEASFYQAGNQAMKFSTAGLNWK